MGSPYIEKSKHGDFTSAVEGHILRGEDPKRLLKAAPGGTKAWNSSEAPFPDERGVNYTPRSQAGHTVK